MHPAQKLYHETDIEIHYRFFEVLSMNSIKASCTAQGWCQKSSHRGAKASDRGLKSLVFKCSFDKFSPAITTNFLRPGLQASDRRP